MINDSDLPLLLTISLTHLRVVSENELGTSVAGSWSGMQTLRAITELGKLRNAEDPTGEIVRGVQDMLEDLIVLLDDSSTKALAASILQMAREVIGEDPIF